ncbi:MAG TPA: ABC transporter permease [candidate division WOR-3 bacterium]|uniref:ABC transporter permease n=1 Tax=candidate division WOR-3 bacterium TaxID=2052148 RepID=A0A7V0LUV5_UNCW3|nr:ABC transporter permease [candidate division WOR-3 bacterium]
MRHNLQQLKSDKLALTGIIIILILAFIAIFAPYLSLYDPLEVNMANRLQMPSEEHPLGTDQLGRDLLSRIIYATYVSITAAALATLMIITFGVTIGAIAGYFGGIVDQAIMRIVDVLLAFPSLILTIAIAGILGPSLMNLIIAMTATGWVGYSRIIRGSVLSIKEKEFVEAARALGFGNLYIIARHIIPNVISPVVVIATIDMGHIILSITGLSFLGLGAQPPTPEWGTMLNEGKSFMTTAPHLMIFPGLMIMITVLAFNFLGDGLRDALDPRLRQVMMMK